VDGVGEVDEQRFRHGVVLLSQEPSAHHSTCASNTTHEQDVQVGYVRITNTAQITVSINLGIPPGQHWLTDAPCQLVICGLAPGQSAQRASLPFTFRSKAIASALPPSTSLYHVALCSVAAASLAAS
jgi:hypothetical protein